MLVQKLSLGATSDQHDIMIGKAGVHSTTWCDNVGLAGRMGHMHDRSCQWQSKLSARTYRSSKRVGEQRVQIINHISGNKYLVELICH